ncbi:hypothetical protein WJX84_004921 [Apatococcus fuscideae]|uniref:Ribosomal protein L34 n=1 Tax=Apatococcus fuscideae TaxID=2026836 RepID=A0AAW1SPG6_9CHLO
MQCLTTPVLRPARLAAVRQSSRPVLSKSEFCGCSLRKQGLVASFAGLSLQTGWTSPLRQAKQQRLVVQAGRGGSQATTLQGTRRRRTRTSGFRTRMNSPTGRSVLKARRKKGRKIVATCFNFNKQLKNPSK